MIAPSFNNLTSLIAKVDHNINQNNIITGRYYFGDSVQSFPLALTGGGVLPGFNTYTPTRVQLVSISYVSIFSPRKSMKCVSAGTALRRVSFRRTRVSTQHRRALRGDHHGRLHGVKFRKSGLPMITVSGLSQLGANKSTPRHRVDSNWQALDNFSWKVSKHDVKFGYEFRRTTIQQFLVKIFVESWALIV